MTTTLGRSLSLFFTFILLGCLCNVHASQQTIYINKGHLITSDSLSLPYYTYNSSSNFESSNTLIKLAVNDSLYLTIVNNDSSDHGFTIKEMSLGDTISAFDSITIGLKFNEIGTFIMFDHLNNSRCANMGLSAILHVYDPNAELPSFYWNIKDHQKEVYHQLENELVVDWSQYYPQYFTLNGRHNPHINKDSIARVTGSVGDSILIHMVNTGNSTHSIHYHGYHAEIVQSSKYPSHVKRKKDTFAVLPFEVVVVLLVPDQVGEYPVHDHNLVAVTGGGIYPNGMFLTLKIQ